MHTGVHAVPHANLGLKLAQLCNPTAAIVSPSFLRLFRELLMALQWTNFFRVFAARTGSFCSYIHIGQKILCRGNFMLQKSSV